MRVKEQVVAPAVVFVVLAALLAYGCTITGNFMKEQTVAQEEFFNITLHFCSREDCLQKIISQLNNARSSASCAFYRVDGQLIGSIPAAAAAEIVVDEKAVIATAANFPNKTVYKSQSKGIMHNKYCIIDNTTILTGSFNPVAAAKNDYNNLLIINSTSLAAFYISDFERLKDSYKRKAPTTAAVANSGTKPKTVVLNETVVEAYFCPEDNCAKAVKEKIRAANSSIVFAAYSFTHPEIASELIIKVSEGVSVAGVIEKSTTGSRYSKHAAMAANGIAVRLESSKRLMHHKFFVIDNETVITGSFNPTKNADERNSENIVIIRNKEVAAAYAEEFNRIYGDADAQK